MKVAIIPARGGSKRIPGKNIRQFTGKPIIAYSIEAALATELFDKVIVSTDSEEIGDIARQYGAEVPFFRPPEIAGDHSLLPPVLIHALDWLKDQDAFPEFFCTILPTAPLICPQQIQKGYELLIKKQVSAVISVTTFPFPILRAFKINKSGYLQMLWPEHELTRSNDLEEAYHDAGQFYWLNTTRFYENQRIFSPDAIPVFLDRHTVQDIDTVEDWLTCEHLYLALHNNLREKID